MAWASFQKSNWTRTAVGEHARQYFPASVAGYLDGATTTTATVTGNMTFTAGQVHLVSLTATYQFQGNGHTDIKLPMAGGVTSGLSGGETAVAAGVNIGNAWLQGPSSGSYAAGNHPLIVFKISSTVAYTTAAAGYDLIAVQY
jgi:hypothetical protein